jgi:hypothetical protein
MQQWADPMIKDNVGENGILQEKDGTISTKIDGRYYAIWSILNQYSRMEYGSFKVRPL